MYIHSDSRTQFKDGGIGVSSRQGRQTDRATSATQGTFSMMLPVLYTGESGKGCILIFGVSLTFFSLYSSTDHRPSVDLNVLSSPYQGIVAVRRPYKLQRY